MLALERMRIIDLAHHWASSTHAQYQSKLRFLRSFQTRFQGLTIHSPNELIRPPTGVDIALMWAEQAYSLWPGKDESSVAFGTIRSLRSALSQFEAVKAIHSGFPTWMDQQRGLLFQPCRSTDHAPHTFFTSGLAAQS